MSGKLAFIAAHMAEHAVRLMCRVLGVSRSWFMPGSGRPPQEPSAPPGVRFLSLRFGKFRGRPATVRRPPGSRRSSGQGTTDIKADGRQADETERHSAAPREAPRANHHRQSARARRGANLLDRNFAIAVPDTVWLADISYIPTDEGWLYLAAVKDLATMEIVGWSMSDRLKSTVCEDALKMAIRNRRPPRGLIHHSDRGVQYACGDYRKLLEANGITASMSRKGNCLDNAPMESFFGALKTELVHRTRFEPGARRGPCSSSTSRSSTTGNAVIRAWDTEHQRRQGST